MASVHRTPGYQAVADICNALGIPHTVEHGGKHPKVVFVYGGHPFKIVISGSPGDYRAYRNSRSATLRVLRNAAVPIPKEV